MSVVLMIAIGFCGILFMGIWFFFSMANVEKKMRTAFQSLAFEVLEKSATTFLDKARLSLEKTEEQGRSELAKRQQEISAILVPFQESLMKLEKYQREIEVKREGAYASLNQQIETMMRLENELRKETAGLSSALRSPPARGAWGQVHLRRVVELAGLVNRCDFSEQTSHECDGKLLRPDLIIHLPGSRHIIVDAKTPIQSFLEAQEAPEPIRIKMLESHTVQLRKHMKDLSQKDYWKRFDLSPEFVVLFLPAESFFSAAVQIDPSLIEVGAEQNIIIATPTTLIAILRAIANSWKQEALSRSSEQIALLGQELFDRLTTLTDHWSKVGRSLSTAVEAYNQAVASMEHRVLVPARKLKEFGAAPIQKELVRVEPIEKLIRNADVTV